MNLETVQIAAAAGAAAALVAIAVLALASAFDAWRDRRRPWATPGSPPVTFLFDGDRLVDATDAARRILALAPGDGSVRDRLITLLRPRFADLDERIRGLMRGETARLGDPLGAGLILSEAAGRLSLTLDPPASDDGTGPDDADQRVFEDELRTLRAITAAAPIPIWRQTRDGRVTWVNAAYLGLVTARHGPDADRAWPLPPLFDIAFSGDAASQPRRIGLPATEDQPQAWFECRTVAMGDEMLASAVDIDAVVRAENTLREFVQTLSKTFAHLPIGLAVFGRDRRLAMFNPALTDLTTLPISVLLGKPTLPAFFDALRNRKMMPEPRDYIAWRDRVATLEAEIADGTLSETWHLPFDRTYRVTARPQPGGALALLVEDISAEVRLTRQNRDQIAGVHAALDAMPEAIAVFDAAGNLTLTNSAHDTLWGGNSREGVGDATVRDAVRRWASVCPPHPLWDEVVAWVVRDGPAPKPAVVPLADGRRVTARFVPLPGGCAMARFTLAAHDTKNAATKARFVAPPGPRTTDIATAGGRI